MASLISETLNCPFIEGDRYHPAENIAKMSRGEPLTDNDREPWLATLADIISTTVASKHRVVLSCSALKPHYRNALRGDTRSGTVAFILLEPSQEELAKRVEARGVSGAHFMPGSLLESQLQTLDYSSEELFMHLKPDSGTGMMPSPDELAAAVVRQIKK